MITKRVQYRLFLPVKAIYYCHVKRNRKLSSTEQLTIELIFLLIKPCNQKGRAEVLTELKGSKQVGFNIKQIIL